MQSAAQGVVVILGTGGTIAGTASDPSDLVGYTAGTLSVQALVAAVPDLASAPIECEQVAQVDSKDMGFELWRRLAERVAAHLARAEVQGVVITHGTDTLEETAYFLHRVLPAAKPVALTAAMRPASARDADGPRNLADAVAVARADGLQGVVVVVAGQVHRAPEVHKAHTTQLQAFDSGDRGPWADLVGGRLRVLRPADEARPLGLDVIRPAAGTWPVVEIVTSHVQARGEAVDALVASGAVGLIVAGTGNGTVHQALLPALARAHARGLPVWRSTRCERGGVVGSTEGALPSAGPLSPVQARIELMLQLLAGGPITPPSA